MKRKNFVLNCTTRELVILIDSLSNYRSILEDSVSFLEKDFSDFPVLESLESLEEKLNSFL